MERKKSYYKTLSTPCFHWKKKGLITSSLLVFLMPKKPKLNFERLKKRIKSEKTFKSQVRSKIADKFYRIRIAFLGQQTFYKSLGTADRAKIRDLLVKTVIEGETLREKTSELGKLLDKRKISQEEYRERVQKSPEALRMHMLNEEILEFLAAHNIPPDEWSNFIKQVGAFLKNLYKN